MQLLDRPAEYAKNKFVLTEESEYFLPYCDEAEVPSFKDIIGEIFDLDNSEVLEDVDEQLNEGRIVLGHYSFFNKEPDVHVPLETSEYVEKRIADVFGSA